MMGTVFSSALDAFSVVGPVEESFVVERDCDGRLEAASGAEEACEPWTCVCMYVFVCACVRVNIQRERERERERV